PGDLRIGRYPHNADAILGGGNCARCMGAMSIVILPGVRILVWDAPDARHAVAKVYIGRQIGVRKVQPGINIPDNHRTAAASDVMRLKSVNLVHVPLAAREVVHAGSRCAGCCRLARGARVAGVVAQAGAEGSRCRGTLHPAILRHIAGKGRVVGTSDGNTDGIVAVDEGTTCGSDRVRSDGRLIEQDEIPLLGVSVRRPDPHASEGQCADESQQRNRQADFANMRVEENGSSEHRGISLLR
ncbi:MAG TPA: hypothetical protein VFZ02_05045, partial [Ktedonobacteraceae bacterium]